MTHNIGDLVVVRRNLDGRTNQLAQSIRAGAQGTIVDLSETGFASVEFKNSSNRSTQRFLIRAEDLAPAPTNWTFHVEEVSNCVYRAIGTGPRGMRTESTDSDPDKVLADCREFALRYPS